MSMDDKTRVLPGVANAGVGTQLSGIYELDARLASGGMGEVYRGHNIQTGDLVAIKIVLPEFARDQTILSLFRKEASILNHLSHDAIVRYHVFTIDPSIGRPYLAMEFVDGPSLFDIMRDGPVPADQVSRLCHRLASGLSAAHHAGTVHRDLSPDNIILPGGNVDRAKIIDFGIARSANVGGETLIGGRFAGKYNYVSPEQLGLFGGDVTDQSDIYSLGLVLAAALRGKPLDMSGSQFEVVEKRRSVPDLAGIDSSLQPIIEAMLQPDPRDRPTSMAHIAGATIPPPSADRSAAQARGEGWPAYLDPSSADAGNAAVSHRPKSASPAAPFVEHVRPAYLSQPKPQPARPAVKSPGVEARKHSAGPLIAVGLGVLALAAGAGAYLTGLISLRDEIPAAPRTTTLSPSSVQPPEQPKAAPDQITQNAPSVAPPETTIAPPPEPAPSAQADTETSAQPARPEPPPSLPQPEAARQPLPQTAEPAPVTPAPVAPPKETAAAPTLQPAPAETAKVEPEATAPSPASPPSSGADTPRPPNEQIALDVPKPQLPPGNAVDSLAERITWLRDYKGGNCFFATASSVTDKSIDIEGFGTAVEPFAEMLAAFQSRFNLEPDISVRLIEPAQCEVTAFLHDLAETGVEKPTLSLERTSVPSGTPISGTLETAGGLRSNLLLIDHKGMAFNLDQRLKVANGKATFNIPIGLSETDRASGKLVPQLIVAVTAPGDISAADFSTPTPANVVLPKILAEIRSRGLEGSAAAKYFRLGG